MATTVDPYLSGGFAPVADEVEHVDLAVRGRLPEALTGRYLRTGPNPIVPPAPPHHWFTGDGMVHGLHLDGGRVRWYRNRWVRTGPVAAHLGEPARGGPPQPYYDASNTNVLAFGGRTLSLTEGAVPYELDDDLDTVGRVAFGAQLPHGLTAHPKLDPATGDLHGFAYGWEQPWLLYHRITAAGEVVDTRPVDLPAPVSMHDFLLTEHHVLFLDQPAVFDLEAATTTGFPYRWKPELGARVGVLPLAGGAVRWFEAPLGYSFHPLNAWEEGGTIVVDLPLLASVYEHPGLSPFLGLQRWTLDLDAGTLSSDVLDEDGQEFCRVPDALVGRPARYGYTIEFGETREFEGTRAYKRDLGTGTKVVHDFGPGHHPGEFVFVPDPDRARDEDGGWLLGLVHPAGEDRTTFAVLDAQDVAGPPVAEVTIPVRVPFGFHGNWVPGPGSSLSPATT